MEQNVIILGMALVLIGIFLLIIGSFVGTKGESKAEWSIGGFIGPVPFGFASNRNMLYLTIAICLAVLIFYLLNLKIGFNN